MNDDLGQIIIMVCCIFMSAYFSATETAFSTLNKARVKTLAEKGNKSAALTIKLVEDYNKLLSTILIGNNIVNILLSALATVFFVKYVGEAGVTVSTVVCTVLVLIFGEITPKSLAKDFPEKFAMVTARWIHVLIVVLTPFTALFGAWQTLISKIFKPSDDRRMTDDELLTIVEEAASDGGIDEQEGELIKSIIEFNDQEAQDVLTPRVDIDAVSVDSDADTVKKVFMDTGYSRLPVCGENIDNIIGIIHQKDFYAAVHNGMTSIKSIMKEPVFITPTMKIGDLLTLLQKTKSHIAVVSDEYGGTMGIVTMEDVLEELVGEIWDEHDEVIEEFTKLGENEYRIMCSADLDDMFEYFDLSGEFDATSVSGWVMEELGRIPNEGDTFEYENLFVTVTATDYQRVLEINVKVIAPEEDDEDKDEEESKKADNKKSESKK